MEPVYVLFTNPPGPGALPLVNEAIEKTSEDGKNDMVDAVRAAADKGCEFVEVETASGQGVGVGSLTMRGYWAVGPLVSLSELAELLAPFADMADWCDEMRHPDDATCGHRIEARLLREVRALVRPTPAPTTVDDYDAEVRATASAARASFRSSLFPAVEADTLWAREGLPQTWVCAEVNDGMARLEREGGGFMHIPVPSLRHGDNGWRAIGTVEHPLAWSA